MTALIFPSNLSPFLRVSVAVYISASLALSAKILSMAKHTGSSDLDGKAALMSLELVAATATCLHVTLWVSHAETKHLELWI